MGCPQDQVATRVDGVKHTLAGLSAGAGADRSDGRTVRRGVARIFRQRPGQADYPYLSEMPIDTFSLENLKRIFGGGKYLVRFAAKGGRYVRSIRFSIDNCFKGEMDIVTPTTTAPAQNNDSTNTLMAFMMQQQQSQQQQQQNMMTLMMTMMTESQKSMAGVMVAAMGGKPSQEPASKFIDVHALGNGGFDILFTVSQSKGHLERLVGTRLLHVITRN